MFRLRTLGGCVLERDGAPLDGVAGQRKRLALLALLAAAGERGVSRETAAAALWSEVDEERAAASLKQLVHSVRQQLGAPESLLGPAVLRRPSDRPTDRWKDTKPPFFRVRPPERDVASTMVAILAIFFPSAAQVT